jgi:hypothetical protein
MQHQKQDDPVILDRQPWFHSNLLTQLRLFGLLALMIPLFSGLQYIVREGVPRVEVRLVTQDVPTTIAVEVPVERVVERVVYVPVERASMVATTGVMEPARDVEVAQVKDEATAAMADVPTGAPESESEAIAEASAPPSTVAEELIESTEVIGLVAYAPPPPPAPVVRAATVARPAVIVAAPEEDASEEIVADAEAVADAEDDSLEAGAVAELPEADQAARVALLVPVRQLGPGSNDSAMNGLRHELHQSEPKQDAVPPAPEPAVAAEAGVPEEAVAEDGDPEADVADEGAESEPAEEMAGTEDAGAPAQTGAVHDEAVAATDEDEPVDVGADDDAAPDDGGVADSEMPHEDGEGRQAEQPGPVLISNQ